MSAHDAMQAFLGFQFVLIATFVVFLEIALIVDALLCCFSKKEKGEDL